MRRSGSRFRFRALEAAPCAALLAVMACGSTASAPSGDPDVGGSGGDGGSAASGAGGKTSVSGGAASHAGTPSGGASAANTGGSMSMAGSGSGAVGGGSAASGGASGAPPASGGMAQSGGRDTGGGGVGAATSAGAGGSSAGGNAGRGNGGASGTMGGSAGATGGGTGGVPSNLDLVVAPDGVESAAGTLDAPTTLASALTRITAGHTIFARAGSYVSDAQVTIARDNSGTSDAPKWLVAYGSERPVLDFSSQPYGTSSNPRGLQINGSYWHVRGLEVVGSADNGIYVAGNGNVIEGCVTHGNRDTGLQIGRASSDDTDPSSWPSDNLILNCESYDNYDEPPGGGENADGFAAKLTVGTGNVFRGCVSHHNIDDGWDLYTKTETGPIGPVTIDQCVAYSNGTLTDGTSNENGDRNGFKLGGDDIAVAHVVTRSVAFKNGKNGFTWNSNPGAIRLSNNLAFDNVEGNFKFGDNSTPTAAVFTNDVSLFTSTSSTESDKAMGTDQGGTNAWWDKSDAVSVTAKGLSVTTADFAVALTSPKLTRKPDGSLDFAAFALAEGSELVNAGVVPPGELPFTPASYYQGLPDLGAVETK